MEKFPAEFYEIFKQHLVAKGVETSEISSCEQEILKGKYSNLIDAVRQRNLIDEEELEDLIKSVHAQFSDLESDEEAESSDFFAPMPKIEDDSELFVPNYHPFFWQDESESEEILPADQEVQSSDTIEKAESVDILTFESAGESGEVEDKYSEDFELDENGIVTSEDLEEDSLKVKKEVSLDTARINPEIKKDTTTSLESEYIAPPPAGSTRKTKPKLENETIAEKTAPRSSDSTQRTYKHIQIAQASTRIHRMTPRKMMVNNPKFNLRVSKKAKKTDKDFNDSSLNLTNLSGYTLAGRYKLLESLGFGGNSAVYKAQKLNAKVNNTYAVKIISPEETDPGKYLARFKQEAEMLQKLSHGPNIVRINAYGKDKNLYYLAMNYVEGESLASLIARKAPLSEELTLQIIREILRALYHAHANGIIHRDIKPGNILIGKDGSIRLTDFGFALDVNIDQRQTSPGQILGTPHYMAPEQISNQKIDARTDLYSIGIVLYECLTGQRPFNEPTDLMLLSSVIAKNPEKPSKLNPKITKFTEKIILQLLKKEPRARFQNAKELYEVLAKAKLPTPQRIFDLEPKIDDHPQKSSILFQNFIQKVDDRPISKEDYITKSEKKTSLVFERKSKRVNSDKLSAQLGSEEKIMEILKVVESKNAIPYPGLKPSMSTKEEAHSERLKTIAKNNIQKLKQSFRTSQRILTTIESKKHRTLKILLLLLFIAGLLLLIETFFSFRATIGTKLPANTLAYFECKDFSTFEKMLLKANYFKNEKKVDEFFRTTKSRISLDIANSFGFDNTDITDEIIESIKNFTLTVCTVEDEKAWAVLFELSDSRILRMIRTDSDYIEVGFKQASEQSVLPPYLVVLADTVLAFASTSEYAEMLKKSFIELKNQIPIEKLDKYFVESKETNINVYLDLSKTNELFELGDSYTWLNKDLLQGITSLSIVPISVTNDKILQIVPSTNDNFPFGHTEFERKSDFTTLKFVPVDAASFTTCDFANVSSAASWFRHYFADSFLMELVKDEKQFISSLMGEVSIVKLANFENKIYVFHIKKENKALIQSALHAAFHDNKTIGDNIFNEKDIFWCLNSEVLAITSIRNENILTPESILSIGKGAILACVNAEQSNLQKTTFLEHERFSEVRNVLEKNVAIMHFSTLRDFIGCKESVFASAFSNIKNQYLIGICFFEKENGEYSIQISLDPAELMGLLLLKYSVSSEQIDVSQTRPRN